MKQNRNTFQKEDAVTSVVGEILLLALVIVLVSLFSVSALSLLPGERELTADIVLEDYNPSLHNLSFWHKGGDWIDASKISVTVITESGDKYTLEKIALKDCKGIDKAVFDLGGNLITEVPSVLWGSGLCSVRFIAGNTVLYRNDGVIL